MDQEIISEIRNKLLTLKIAMEKIKDRIFFYPSLGNRSRPVSILRIYTADFVRLPSSGVYRFKILLDVRKMEKNRDRHYLLKRDIENGDFS